MSAFDSYSAHPVDIWDCPKGATVLLSGHESPNYDSDPGTGFEVWQADGRLFLAVCYDGAYRSCFELVA